MKKTKFLSLLLFAPLLASCGGKVKAPKFLDKGKEIKKADFVVALNKVFDKASFNDTTKKLGQGEFKYETTVRDFNETLRGKKSLSKFTELEKTAEDHKYDPKQLVDRYTFRYEDKVVKEDAAGKDVSNAKTKADCAYQYAKVGKKEYIVTVSGNEKAYVKEYEASKADIETGFDFSAKSYANSAFEEVYNMIDEYDAKEGEALKDYKFYKNGNVFTIEQNTEITVEHKEDEKVDYVTVSKITQIAQIDATEGKWASKFYYHEESDREFKLNAGQFAAGDVYHSEYDIVYEVSYEVKEVKVEKFDLKDFVGFGFEE